MDSGDDQAKCFFLDGPGGSGKTYLYRVLIKYIRGRRGIVLSYASTGVAANEIPDGQTYHSGFELTIPVDERAISNVKQTSEKAQNIIAAQLIIIDECTMMSKHALRCIDGVLRDIMHNDIPFGGKVVVIGGDFRQCLPVVPRGKEIDVIQDCIKSSPLWRHFAQLSLVTNMRSEGQAQFNQWLLDVGSGNLPHIDGLPEGTIQIPESMVIDTDIVTVIYGNNLTTLPVEELARRAILCPKNSDVLAINNDIIRKLPGVAKTYYSSDSIISSDTDDVQNYPQEFLHSLCLSGMPPHQLTLKVGSIVMLIRNLNSKAGLCNGTRLYVRALHRNSIVGEIISECHRGDIVTIPRINFQPNDQPLPFLLKRRQFPIIPAFAMTINKSQGQTFDFVGIFLSRPVFSHGQLYVALSRSRNKDMIKVVIQARHDEGRLLGNSRTFTKNLIFRRALQ